MKSLNRIVFASLTLLTISFLLPSEALGQCTCSKYGQTAVEEYRRATLVFTGEIMDVQRSEPDKNGRFYETAKVLADRAWKNDIESVITIKNYVTGCVQSWTKGDKFLVYAYLNDDNVTYSTGCCCSLTGKLEKRKNDISDFMTAGFQQSVIRPPKEKIISAGWLNSRALNFENPRYPQALTTRIAARVEVGILTDADGSVISAEIIRGPSEFHAAALEAARMLRFRPTRLEGVPTKVSGWVSYDFKP